MAVHIDIGVLPIELFDHVSREQPGRALPWRLTSSTSGLMWAECRDRWCNGLTARTKIGPILHNGERARNAEMRAFHVASTPVPNSAHFFSPSTLRAAHTRLGGLRCLMESKGATRAGSGTLVSLNCPKQMGSARHGHTPGARDSDLLE